MRFYDRVLSDSELAAHYKIDKQRFGILDEVTTYDAELEYIENKDGAYINTGLKHSLDTHFSFDMYGYEGIGNPCLYIMGARTSATQSCLNVICKNEEGATDNGIRYDLGNKRIFIPDGKLMDINKVVHIDNIPNAYTFHYESYSATITSTATFSTSRSIYMFAINHNDTPYLAAQTFRLYYLKLYSGDTLVRDYIPVRKGNAAYLYDKLTGRFYGNANTVGSLIAGPDKTT